MRDIVYKARDIVFQNLANVVTSIGIVLIVWLNILLWNEPVDHLLIFLLAASIGISDLLDGWLSRRWQIDSSIGGFLDKFETNYFLVLFSLILFINYGTGLMGFGWV